MRLVLALACAAAAVLLTTLGSSSVVAADYCAVDGAVAIRPATVEIGVQHKVTLLFTPKFDESYLVPGSLKFHVSGPSGAFDVPEAGDSHGASFTPTAVGPWSASATWSQYDCDQPDATKEGQTAPTNFTIFEDLHATEAEFSISHPLGRGAGGEVSFLAGWVCPPVERTIAEPLSLTLYYEIGLKAPTHASHQLFSRSPNNGCYPSSAGGGSGSKDHRWPWGFTTGGGMTVFQPHSARVLAEVRRGSVLIGAIRLRFKPVHGGEAIVRDVGKCPGLPRCDTKVSVY
ncbi:MAG: hypothetical protein QOJ29_1553 [Thermoleophilaceae bacterium]|nr:hypothetical protein [Thermoleophilaceae bacterium]